ncbi:protein NETWORKED 4A-like [Trifolium pratense]|uniref:protein NETWORKED 4A-like n=1 Tax=Trifolium pratense TaxID=57577 RepID=UPI001E697DD9|nr:protein NETWORKED 4A-like [Trifolium pratense]
MSHKKSTKRSLTSQMDRNIRQMMKLIEDNGDSFAQKAEMYYKKRPELISLVEEFYRGYRSLAERYEHVTGELWKNIPSDLQSHGSFVSDNGSEPPPSLPSASPIKMGRRIASNRAAGFDFFLGSGGNNFDATSQKDGDASSTLTDSDDEFDDASSINSYSGYFGNSSDHGMTKRVIELEIDLREVKEKLLFYEQQEHGEYFGDKINAYAQELKNVNEHLRHSEEEINKLNIEVEKYKSMESSIHLQDDTCSRLGQDRSELDQCTINTHELSSSSTKKDIDDDLRLEKEKVENFEMQIASSKIEASKSNENFQQLQDQLNLAHKEVATWKNKFDSLKSDNTKLQEKVSMLQTCLSERENEIKDLNAVLFDTEQKSFFEKAQLKTEVCKLLEKQNHMEIRLKGETEILKGEIKDMKKNVEEINVSLKGLVLERDNLKQEVGLLKEEMNSRGKIIQQAYRHVVKLESRAKELEDEIERQKIEILEGAEEKREAIRQLCFSLEHYRNGYNVLRKAFIDHKRLPVLAS